MQACMIIKYIKKTKVVFEISGERMSYLIHWGAITAETLSKVNNTFIYKNPRELKEKLSCEKN